MSGSLKDTPTQTLLLELVLPSHDLSRLQDGKATGEVVKIG